MLGVMSATADDPPAAETVPRDPADRARDHVSDGLVVCPFLRARDGGWSSAYASRDLRCWAVRPAAQLAVSKQRQLCVLAAHATCATYVAAVAADPILVADDPDASGLWPAASPIPVALEAVHARSAVNVPAPRSGGQALLVGLMVLAFLVLVIARTAVPSTQGGGVGGSPAAASLVAGLSTSPTTAAAASVVPSASAAPSTAPSPSSASAPASNSPAPSASVRTYKVKSGDTLGSIALKFNTTVKAIVAANAIADRRTIRTGQILVIP